MLARKLPFYALTFLVAITIDFFIPRLMPGNALDAVLAKAGSQMGSRQALHALEKLYGIGNPASLPPSTGSSGRTSCTATWAPRPAPTRRRSPR